jgi:hypothetical protein
LEKKLSGQCPCGHFFGTFDNVKDALVKVKLHFEFCHKDFLPFGITDAEALALFKKGLSQGKKLICLKNVCYKRDRRIAQQMT